MRIDVHAHYFPREYVETIGRLLGTEHVRPSLSAPGANLDASERLALMDSAGIDLQVLSASLLQPYGADPAASAAAARLGNDLYAEVCQRHPRIRVLVPHLGGTLPFMMGRIGRATAAERERTGQPPVYFEESLRENLRRCWYDTVNLEPTALRCACDVLGYERLVLGTDFP